MKMEIRFGNPVLILLYSAFLLVTGCAIGMFWFKTPEIAIKVAIVGAVLIVIHDMLMALLSLYAARIWIRSQSK